MSQSLSLKGQLISKLAKVTGQSAKGAWEKQEFVIETLDKDHPKKVCLTAWGDSIEKLRAFKQHDVLTVTFGAESRQHNERWYTELRAFKFEADIDTPVGSPRAKPPVQQRVEREPQYEDSGADSLPF